MPIGEEMYKEEYLAQPLKKNTAKQKSGHYWYFAPSIIRGIRRKESFHSDCQMARPRCFHQLLLYNKCPDHDIPDSISIQMR
jgi:hypothetical protein